MKQKLVHKARQIGQWQNQILDVLRHIKGNTILDPVITVPDEQFADNIRQTLNSIKESGLFLEEIKRVQIKIAKQELKGSSENLPSYVLETN